MIDILIPTYNRDKFLIKNILLIDRLITDEGLQDKFRIIVSDNCSTDETWSSLKETKPKISVELLLFQQEENIGLEKNMVFILGKSDADYVMFLGDDDFLPSGYLANVAEVTEKAEVGVIIPRFVALLTDGTVTGGRKDTKTRMHDPGFKAVLDLSRYGHQLSGLVFKREGVLDAYLSDPINRNIYLFIFFISYCMLRYKAQYLPDYAVQVSQGNLKDWSYDDSGLLTEVYKNYQSLFRDSAFKKVLAAVNFTKQQKWRLRLGFNPLNSLKAISHIFTARGTDTSIKVGILLSYIPLYAVAVSSFFKNRLLGPTSSNR